MHARHVPSFWYIKVLLHNKHHGAHSTRNTDRRWHPLTGCHATLQMLHTIKHTGPIDQDMQDTVTYSLMSSYWLSTPEQLQAHQNVGSAT